jgi:hypothetical protein
VPDARIDQLEEQPELDARTVDPLRRRRDRRRWNVCERGVLSNRMLAAASHNRETASRARESISCAKQINWNMPGLAFGLRCWSTVRWRFGHDSADCACLVGVSIARWW